MGNILSVRVEEKKKQQASQILKDLGLDLSTAINIFLTQIIKKGGIPFMIEYPNKETLQVIEESKDEKNILGPYSSFDEMVKDFDKDAD